MKTVSSRAIQLLIISQMLISNLAFSQFIPSTGFVGVPYVSGALSRNTGCDILEFGGDVYRVSVWEPTGTTLSFGWN